MSASEFPKENFPNTFIVGAPKCGTSAMASYLSCHPNVFLPDVKEPFYWSMDYERLRMRHSMTTLENYLELFSPAGPQHSVIVEGSTNYLASEVAIRRILESQPNAKFIAMLRNPVDVVHAFHSEILFSGIETEPDFETAWQLQDQRKAGQLIPAHCEAPQFLQYAEVASYAPQLRRFFSMVPEENRKVILFDDFAADTGASFQEVLDFLSLPSFQMDEFARVNASHDHRFKLLSKMILNPPAPLRPVMEGVRHVARQFRGGMMDHVKHWFRKPVKRNPLSEDFRAQLNQFFAGDVAETSELLGRDLTHWVGLPLVEQNTDQDARPLELQVTGG